VGISKLFWISFILGEYKMILSASAIDKLKDILAEENNPELKLRVFVQGGGCSGFQYGFTLDETQAEDDMDLEYSGVHVVIDSMSWTYLQGAEIRFDDGPMGSQFVIENPNAQSTCGCGSSFNPY
jgi:iron-sulfur cluster insertion protein